MINNYKKLVLVSLEELPYQGNTVLQGFCNNPGASQVYCDSTGDRVIFVWLALLALLLKILWLNAWP